MSERTCAAVVETVSVAVPEPLATEFGLNVQEGDGVAEGAILLQDRLTLALNPFIGVMVIVDVDDPPAEIAAGESGVAPIPKSGAALAEMLRSRVRNGPVATARKLRHWFRDCSSGGPGGFRLRYPTSNSC
jgi:hypothetical protein